MFTSIGPKEPANFKNSFLPNENAVGNYTFLPPNSTTPFKNSHYEEDPRRRTLDPIVTGTSVIAIKFDKGILMASDTLGSYGSLARFRNIERQRPIGASTLIGGSGEYSDFQYILEVLDDLVKEDEVSEDKHHKQPREIYSYLTRVMYNRRSKFDPLYNQLVIAGISTIKEHPVNTSSSSQSSLKLFLGQVDLNGTHFEDNTIATGYGAYIARPLLRKAYRPNLTEEEAREILERCMKVLYYRDARALNRIQLGKVVAKDQGVVVTVSAPYELQTEWRHTESALGYPKPK